MTTIQVDLTEVSVRPYVPLCSRRDTPSQTVTAINVYRKKASCGDECSSKEPTWNCRLIEAPVRWEGYEPVPCLGNSFKISSQPNQSVGLSVKVGIWDFGKQEYIDFIYTGDCIPEDTIRKHVFKDVTSTSKEGSLYTVPCGVSLSRDPSEMAEAHWPSSIKITLLKPTVTPQVKATTSSSSSSYKKATYL